MRLNPIESVEGGTSLTDNRDVQLVPIQSADLCRSCSIQGLIPVVDAHNHPLFPCKPSVARRLVACGKATPFYKKGFFAVRLNKVVENIVSKIVMIAFDPGSKRTGITVATENGVVLNIQCNTPDWVKEKVETKRNYRKARRGRKTPYRECRPNRNIGGLPPSTKARWGSHLRVLDTLCQIIPITHVIIEDIKAATWKNAKKWNKNFSPLEVGKQYFEDQIKERGLVFTKFQGYDTADWRFYRGFKKSSNKLSETWNTHCVDSHCLCEMYLGQDLEPVKKMYVLNFLNLHRRELHQGFKKGGVRRDYGSTRSEGLNRGTLVKHKKHGLAYVGGTSEGKISLHNIETGKRIGQTFKVEDCKILTRTSWRTALPPAPAGRISVPKKR